MRTVGNVLWFLLAGVLLCLTIVGIPFGIACWKMVPLALLPLGRRTVPIDSAPGSPTTFPQSA